VSDRNAPLELNLLYDEENNVWYSPDQTRIESIAELNNDRRKIFFKDIHLTSDSNTVLRWDKEKLRWNLILSECIECDKFQLYWDCDHETKETADQRRMPDNCANFLCNDPTSKCPMLLKEIGSISISNKGHDINLKKEVLDNLNGEFILEIKKKDKKYIIKKCEKK